MATEHNGNAGAPKDEVTQAFLALRDRLSEMQEILRGQPIDMLALAKGYAAVARAMVAATRASGQTSARFDAAEKALDLRTPKGALTRFLAEE